jgi:hypothetical protein
MRAKAPLIRGSDIFGRINKGPKSGILVMNKYFSLLTRSAKENPSVKKSPSLKFSETCNPYHLNISLT